MKWVFIGAAKRWWFPFVLVLPMVTLYLWYNGEDVDEPVTFQEVVEKEKYLVNSTMCRIPDSGAWNHDVMPLYKQTHYIPCDIYDPLTYIENNGTTAVLHINRTVENKYSRRGVICCVSYVHRIDDKNINYTKCEDFEDYISLRENTILVKCYNKKNLQEVYTNAHYAAVINGDLRTKAETLKKELDPPSVLLVGIDSVSRQNFLRLMPKTAEFLDKNDWVSFKGYNKIDDNTFPNLMAILTGLDFPTIEKKCNPYQVNSLHKCNYIWNDYKSFGYVTGYAEDETWLNTFNYLKPGFTNPPTDLYYYPYMLAAEAISTTQLDSMSYCSGPETSSGRIYNAAKDFAVSLKDLPKIGLFWTSTGSHNKLNAAGRLDTTTLKLFQDLQAEKVHENTIIVFFSDHGLRFGNILQTRSGWLEERLPFIYFSIPEKLKKKYPSLILNLKGNCNKLTSPYDFHMTLKDILVLSGLNYNATQSVSCPKCRSLFQEAEKERSCNDAGIAVHWCTCAGYKEISRTDDLVVKSSDYVVEHLNQNLASSKVAKSKCSSLVKDKILSTSISENVLNNSTYILVMFTTIPDMILQATTKVEYENDQPLFTLVGSISRLDLYKQTSVCMDLWKWKIYCHCRYNVLENLKYFGFWFEV